MGVFVGLGFAVTEGSGVDVGLGIGVAVWDGGKEGVATVESERTWLL